MNEMRQFLICQSEDGTTRIDVMLDAETLWLSQKQLTELFGKAKGTISEHIKHIKALMMPVRRMTAGGSIRLMGISGFNPVAPFWS